MNRVSRAYLPGFIGSRRIPTASQSDSQAGGTQGRHDPLELEQRRGDREPKTRANRCEQPEHGEGCTEESDVSEEAPRLGLPLPRIFDGPESVEVVGAPSGQRA